MPLKNLADNELSVMPKEETTRADYSPQESVSESYMLGLGMGDLVQSGMERDSIALQLHNSYQESIDDAGVMPDEKFQEKEKELYWQDNLEGQIHPKLKDAMLERAVSPMHLSSMYQDYFDESARLRYLEDQPWYVNAGIGILGEATNVPLKAGIAVGTIALFPEVALVAGSTFLAGAMVSASAGVALEGIKDNFGHQDKDIWDYGFAIGVDGMIGGLTRKATTSSADTISKYIMKNSGVDDRIAKKAMKASTDTERKEILADAYQAHVGKKATETVLDQLDDNVKFANKNVLQKGWQAMRQDMAYVTGQSKSNTMSQVSRDMFPDPTLANEILDKPALASSRDRLEESMRGVRQQMFNPLAKRFSQAVYNSGGMLGIKVNATVEDTFSDALGRIQLDRNINGTSIEKAVEKVMLDRGISSTNKEAYETLVDGAKEMSELAKKYHTKLGEEGHIDFKLDVDGKSKIPLDETYTPFIYDKSSFSRMSNAGLESKDFINFFQNAMKSNNPDMEREMLNKVATQFYHAISGSKNQNTGTLNEILNEMIVNAKGNKQEIELIESLMRNPAREASEEAVATSARARTNIDYKYRESFKTAEGKDIELSFEELLSKDYIGNMDTYARKMSGATVLQRLKFKDTVQPKTRLEGEAEVFSTKEYKEAKQSIEDRDNAIKELFDRDDEIKKFESSISNEEDLIYSFARDTGIKLDEVADELDNIVKEVGLDKKFVDFDNITARLKQRAELERMRELASSKDLDTNLDEIVRKGLIKTGHKTDIGTVSRNLAKTLRDGNLNDIKKALGNLTEEFGENAPRIKRMVENINNKLKIAGRQAHDRAKVVSDKEKLSGKSRPYKEIFEEEKLRYKVDLKDENLELDKIYKEATFKEDDFSITSAKDFERLRQKISNELDEAVAKGETTVKDAKKDLTRLDTIYRDFSGVSTSVNPTSNANRFYRIGHSYNIGRLLGQTFFTMPAEGMNVVWDSGIRNMLSASKALGDLLSAYKNGKLTRPDLIEINESLGLYDEFLSGAKIFEFDHELSAMHSTIDGSKTMVDKIEGFGQGFSEFTLMMGGIKPLTAMFQTAHVQGVFKKMAKVAKGGKQNSSYKKMVRELGLSERMSARVYEQMNLHSADGLMNFKKWDVETKNIFLDGVKTRSDSLVQMQRLGDKMAWVNGDDDYMLKDTVFGKISMELKQFVLTAYTKQLGRAVNRADMHMVGLMASQMAVLTLSYITKQNYNYAGNQEKLDKALSTERIVAGTLGMMPQGSVMPMLLGLGTSTIFGENIFGNRHSAGATDAINSLPMLDLVNKMMGVFSTPSNMVKDGVELKDFSDIASLTGGSNNVLTKPLWEAGKESKKKNTRAGRI